MITAFKYSSASDFKEPDKHLVIWTEKASGIVEIEKKEYSLNSNDILVIGSSEAFDFKTAEMDGIAVSFTDSDFPDSGVDSVCKIMLFYSQQNVLNQVNIAKKNAKEFEQLFFIIRNEYYLNKKSSVPVLSLMLQTLLLKIEQYIRVNIILTQVKNSIEEELVSSFLKHLENEYKVMHKVSEYAQLLNVSPRKLNDSIKIYFGVSVKELISSKLYIEVAKLLQFSSYSIKEIAYQLGFKSPYQLSNFFSKANGSSPLEYRNSFKA